MSELKPLRLAPRQLVYVNAKEAKEFQETYDSILTAAAILGYAAPLVTEGNVDPTYRKTYKMTMLSKRDSLNHLYSTKLFFFYNKKRGKELIDIEIIVGGYNGMDFAETGDGIMKSNNPKHPKGKVRSSLERLKSVVDFL